MKTITGLLLFLLLTLSTQAAVIVYKRTQKIRYIGRSQDFKIPATGFLILDSGNLYGYTVTIANFRGDKFFNVIRFENNLTIYGAAGPSGSSYTAWLGHTVTNTVSQSRESVEFSLGKNALMAITPTTSMLLPRVVTGNVGGFLLDDGNGILASGTGVASYSPSETRKANDQGETIDDTLARHRASLIERGYRDATE